MESTRICREANVILHHLSPSWHSKETRSPVLSFAMMAASGCASARRLTKLSGSSITPRYPLAAKDAMHSPNPKKMEQAVLEKCGTDTAMILFASPGGGRRAQGGV